MYITFTDSRYLFLLLLIPLIIFIYVLTLRNSKKKALKFANFEAIARVKGVSFFSKEIITTILSSLIIFLFVLSAAGITLHRQAYASSFSFVIAVDVSRSMEARDIFPTRLDASKETAKSFVDAIPATTRVGIVSFSGNTYIHQDITDKKDLMKDAIDIIDISAIEGTDIYEVIITSTNMLRGEEGGSIILFSDGQMNVGELDNAIKYANRNNVIVNTVAVGTTAGGQTLYGTSKLNEDLLKALAYNTEGNYFQTTNKEALLQSVDQILELTKKEVSIDISDYMILAGIILFVLEYLLINSRYKLLPF